MLSPKEKGIESSTPSKPYRYKGVDLSTVPNILSFKAAVSHREAVLKGTLVAILALWGLQFTIDEMNDREMMKEYRKKEFLLAPSELAGITPVKPKTIPPSYVDDVSAIYLSLLGNVNALNIEENYAKLQKHMSDPLRVKFNAEIAPWLETVKSENISEVFKVTKKRYSDTEDGLFKVDAIGLRERYTGHKYVGVDREKIELILRVVAPTTERKWFLRIESLKRGRLRQ